MVGWQFFGASSLSRYMRWELVSIQKWLFFPWVAFSACFRVPVPLNRGGVLTCTPRRKPLCGLAQRKNPSFLNWKLSYCPSTLKTISGWVWVNIVFFVVGVSKADIFFSLWGASVSYRALRFSWLPLALRFPGRRSLQCGRSVPQTGHLFLP